MAAVVASILCCVVAASPSPSVEIGYGKIVGVNTEVPSNCGGTNRSVDAFLGIPYATPPVGALRYARPKPPQPWKPYVLQATAKSPACVQFVPSNSLPGWVAKGIRQSEDCLYLNVWTPDRHAAKTALKSVLVWIHGGGLNYGSASMDLYDGTVLAAVGDVVVVSMNYRLGSFGFLTLGKGGEPSLGNQGLLDQVLALKWVREHIASFGGDPEKVTIFGESAGAWSINYHALSPLARSLFKRAIAQSGAVTVNFLTESVDGAKRRTLALAGSLGCPTASDDGIVECLRNKSAQEIALAEAFVCTDFIICFGAVYGDDYLPRDPVSSADVSVSKDFLFGNVENEGSVFVSLQHWTQFPFKGALDVSKRDMFYFFLKSFAFAPAYVVRHIFDLYLDGVDECDFPNLRAGLGHAVGDAFMRCPEVFFAERLSQQKSRVFYYDMVYRSAHQSARMDSWLGLAHFEELQYVFGLPLRIHRSSTYSDADARFSEEIIRIWTTFASTGSPPDVNDLPWPPFDAQSHSVVSLDLNGSRVGTLEQLNKCRFWEQLMASQRSEAHSCS
ncbi:unnamed protein product [Ixodes hexagonus]